VLLGTDEGVSNRSGGAVARSRAADLPVVAGRARRASHRTSPVTAASRGFGGISWALLWVPS